MLYLDKSNSVNIGEVLCGKSRKAKVSPRNDDGKPITKQSTLAASSRNIVRFSMFINALVLLDFFIFRCGERLVNVNIATSSITTTKATTATATSGKIYQINKIRSYDKSLLRFQSSTSQNDAQREAGWPKEDFWNRPDCKHWGAATTIFPPPMLSSSLVGASSWLEIARGRCPTESNNMVKN